MDKKSYLIEKAKNINIPNTIYDWCSNKNTTSFLLIIFMGKSIVPIQSCKLKLN